MTNQARQETLDDPVSRHMRAEVVTLRAATTLGEALAELRAKPPAERILYFYVVDDNGALCGVVPTRRLLLNPLDARVADVMLSPVISISQSATVLEACEFFVMHRLLAFPVVDEAKRPVGMVDVQLYTDELNDLESSERSDDLFQLVGVHITEARMLSTWSNFRARFPWLLCNVAGGLVAAFLSGLFDAELRRVVELAMFVPVVLALAESVSIQSVSLSLQLMQGQRPTGEKLRGWLRRELAAGALMGVSAGILVAGVALLWPGRPALALCIGSAIAGGITFAASAGLLLPALLRLAQRDPRVAAGPIALALTDMTTLALYFLLARWWL